MTARKLSYVAIAGAAVILAVSFWFTIGAQRDFAVDQGVDPGLANALPVCIEALIIVAGAVMVTRRIDPNADRSRLANLSFVGAVAVTIAVNWAHGIPDAVTPTWVAPLLSAVPALSLPVALHLALEEWLRVRATPKPTKAKARKARAPAPRPVAKPAQVEATTNGPPGNGDHPRNLTRAEVAARYPTLADIDQLLAEHAGNKTDAAKAIPCAKSTFYAHLNDLEGATT